jgi:hypothetical protein
MLLDVVLSIAQKAWADQAPKVKISLQMHWIEQLLGLLPEGTLAWIVTSGVTI